jgi:hypothetical protein
MPAAKQGRAAREIIIRLAFVEGLPPQRFHLSDSFDDRGPRLAPTAPTRLRIHAALFKTNNRQVIAIRSSFVKYP